MRSVQFRDHFLLAVVRHELRVGILRLASRSNVGDVPVHLWEVFTGRTRRPPVLGPICSDRIVSETGYRYGVRYKAPDCVHLLGKKPRFGQEFSSLHTTSIIHDPVRRERLPLDLRNFSDGTRHGLSPPI